MKKIISLFAVIALLAITGCVSGKTTLSVEEVLDSAMKHEIATYRKFPYGQSRKVKHESKIEYRIEDNDADKYTEGIIFTSATEADGRVLHWEDNRKDLSEDGDINIREGYQEISKNVYRIFMLDNDEGEWKSIINYESSSEHDDEDEDEEKEAEVNDNIEFENHDFYQNIIAAECFSVYEGSLHGEPTIAVAGIISGDKVGKNVKEYFKDVSNKEELDDIEFEIVLQFYKKTMGFASISVDGKKSYQKYVDESDKQDINSIRRFAKSVEVKNFYAKVDVWDVGKDRKIQIPKHVLDTGKED